MVFVDEAVGVVSEDLARYRTKISFHYTCRLELFISLC